MNFSRIEKKIAQASADLDAITSELNKERSELKRATKEMKAAAKGMVVLKRLAIETQKSAHAQISEIVSICLSEIFEEPYELKIHFVERRGKTEADLLFVRGGIELDPMTAAGGGVIDVASFALRLACLILSRPHKRRLLILDEPFKFLSRNHHASAAGLLEVLADRLDVQFILATHISALELGKIQGI